MRTGEDEALAALGEYQLPQLVQLWLKADPLALHALAALQVLVWQGRAQRRQVSFFPFSGFRFQGLGFWVWCLGLVFGIEGLCCEPSCFCARPLLVSTWLPS